MLLKNIIIFLLLSVVNSKDYSLDVKNSYYNYTLPDLAASILHKFVVKVIRDKEIMGVGISVRADWVLTAKFYGTVNLNQNRLRVATWDSSIKNLFGLISEHKGQVKRVIRIVEHPRISGESCNYDMVLMQLKSGFKQLALSSSTNAILENLPIWKPNEDCKIVAAYKNHIASKKVRILELGECADHKYYKYYSKCEAERDLICIHMNEPLYGAPLMCGPDILGIVPSDIDRTEGMAVIQFINTYTEWMSGQVGGIDVVRSNSRPKASIHINFILVYIFILVLLHCK